MALGAGLVGCDHVTKAAAVSHLATAPLTVVPGALRLVYAENHDVAFSVLRHVNLPGRVWVLALIPALMTVGLVVRMVQRRAAPLPERLAYMLLIAGALGNTIDRFARGFVVDFIQVPHWPVFNVADILVVVGAALLVIATRRSQIASEAA